MDTATARRWLVVSITSILVVAMAHAGPAAAQIGTTPAPSCAVINVDDVVAQAANQYSAGFAGSALALISKALACRQDARMYRMAVLYACAAQDAAAAQLHFANVPQQYQPTLMQRCQLSGVVLGASGATGAQPATSTTASRTGAGSGPQVRTSTPVVLRARPGQAAAPGCDQRLVDDLMYEAADRFIAGNARAALATMAEALACKQTVQMFRMAAIYACVAHDDSAQRYYLELPRQARAFVKQRCRQENIELVEAAPVPAVAASSAAAVPPANPAACATVNIASIVSQARDHYTNGRPRSALALMAQGLACVQNDALYRLAIKYACAARELATAKRYFSSVSPAFQPVAEQACLREGLNVRAP